MTFTFPEHGNLGRGKNPERRGGEKGCTLKQPHKRRKLRVSNRRGTRRRKRRRRRRRRGQLSGADTGRKTGGGGRRKKYREDSYISVKFFLSGEKGREGRRGRDRPWGKGGEKKREGGRHKALHLPSAGRENRHTFFTADLFDPCVPLSCDSSVWELSKNKS